MKTSDIKQFSQAHFLAALGPEYEIVASRDLVRMYGPFVQSVLLSIKRSGWLHVIPTFYVVGADPEHEVMFQTMSLPISGIDSKRIWNISPETPLDNSLAVRLVSQIEKESPLSFRKPLTDKGIHHLISKYCKLKKHWYPSLALFYWEMLSGTKTPAKTLDKSKKEFVKYSSYGAGKEPFDYEQKLMTRYEELEERIHAVDGVKKCKHEAEIHAKKLKLPKINWPVDWKL